MSQEVLSVDEVEAAAPEVMPMIAAGWFVWTTILGAEADPFALRWDVLFLGCTLLLIACIAHSVSGAASEATAAAGAARVAVAAAGLVELYNVVAMWMGGDPRVWAAMAAAAGAAVLFAHLTRLRV
jgi:hypothetical protein